MNVARQALRSISLVVDKGVQMLEVAWPLYEDTDVTNEPIAQPAASLFTTLRCRPAGVSESLSFQSSAESGLGIKQAIRSSV